MCEVCAVFSRGRHWTARASGIRGTVESVDLRGYRLERRQALRLVNALLATRQLAAADWDGEAYLVTAQSGASIKTTDLAELWTAPQRLGKDEIDPLAADFLEPAP
jgi:hypothetical protein